MSIRLSMLRSIQIRMPNGIPELFRQFGFPVPEMYKEPEAKADETEQLKPYGAGSGCLLYTSPSPRDGLLSRMPSSA